MLVIFLYSSIDYNESKGSFSFVIAITFVLLLVHNELNNKSNVLAYLIDIFMMSLCCLGYRIVIGMKCTQTNEGKYSKIS